VVAQAPAAVGVEAVVAEAPAAVLVVVERLVSGALGLWLWWLKVFNGSWVSQGWGLRGLGWSSRGG
jgi:hypothetical protein